MMGPMMMMAMMNKGKKETDPASAALMESLKKQNDMILAMNAGAYGEPRENENGALLNRLNELEEKLASKFSKNSKGGGGMDALFSEDMMSMLMLNMQSSIQMLPLLQQRQLQQKQNQVQFQTYISQMQALNSMLHTLSYGTPLSELNKLHTGVKNQFESYNNEVSSRMKGVINQIKDMRKNAEIDKEKIAHKMQDGEIISDDDEDDEFKDELDKLEEQIENNVRNEKPQSATKLQAPVTVMAAPNLHTIQQPNFATSYSNLNHQAPGMSPMQAAGAMGMGFSQDPYSQYPQMAMSNPYATAPIPPQYYYDDYSDSRRCRDRDRDRKQREESSETKPKKKKKKKSEDEDTVDALKSPRNGNTGQLGGMPNNPMDMMGMMKGMDPMMQNMMLMNLINGLNKDKKKKKKHKHKKDDEEEESSAAKPEVFYHPHGVPFPGGAVPTLGPSRRAGDKPPAGGFGPTADKVTKKKGTFSETQSLNYSKR
jgi:hypothetical protein